MVNQSAAPAGGTAQVRVSVCVATRNRGEAIGPTLQSLRLLDHDAFEVVIVDQSTDARSHDTFQMIVGRDRRFRYVPSGTVGASVARNLAAAQARAPIIAFTDDDCVVPTSWLTHIERHFHAHRRVMMICGAVLAAEHDETSGAIPTFTPRGFQELRSPWLKFRTRGISANLAVRADALRRVGPMDEVLGAGAPLKSCEDGDLEYRFLRAGLGILDAPEPAVLHYGFRSWAELKTLSRGALLGCGATCMKHLRMGDPAIVSTLLFLWFGRTVRWRNVARLRRPVGASLFYEFAHGMVLSFNYRIDRRAGTYVAEQSQPGRV